MYIIRIYRLYDIDYAVLHVTDRLLTALINPGDSTTPYTICHKLQFSLTNSQFQLCDEYPQLFPMAIRTEAAFQHHCQRQFKFERWNCQNIYSPLGLHRKPQPFLNLGELNWRLYSYNY